MASTARNSSGARIHILGLGNLGRLYAYALATSPNAPPVTLLLHRASLLKEWQDAGQKIEIKGDPKFIPETLCTWLDTSSGCYDVEVIEESESSKDVGKEGIQNLILATKVSNVVQALIPIAARLNPSSTIVFTQNGMPDLEGVSSRCFGSSEDSQGSCPTYLTAVTSHGIYSKGPFRSVLAGLANVSIGLASYSKHDRTTITPEAQSLIDKITSTPLLNAEAVSKKDLQIRQLQKLVINSTINPLSVIFRNKENTRKNGDLFIHKPILNFMKHLIEEFHEFFRRASSPEPEYQNRSFRLDITPAELEQYFSIPVLENLVLSVAQKTAGNTSSMLQDVQAGRETEIDYINGWFLRHVAPVRLSEQQTENKDVVQRHIAGEMMCNLRTVELVKDRERMDVSGVKSG